MAGTQAQDSNIILQEERATEQKRALRFWRERVFRGGEDRIRTGDRGFRPGNRLAGGPNRPLWHLPID